MRITGFGAVEFSSLGVTCGIPAGAIPIASVQHSMIRRVGAESAFGSATIPERILPVEFIITDLAASGYSSMQNAFSALIAQLDPTNPVPRQIRAVRNDGTNVVINGVLQFNVAAVQGGFANVLPAQFVLTERLWRGVTETEISKSLATAPDQGIRATPLVAGSYPVTVELAASSQRVTQTATLGWTRRRIFTITNNADEPLLNFPLYIGLGDTAALVTAGKALANGNDLRVWIEGKEVPRTLRNWNTATNSGVWIILSNLPVGFAVAVEIVYSNPNAGAPTTLTALSTLPPFDLANSNNESHLFKTDDVAASAGLGAWGLSSGTAVPQASFEVPGAWRRAMTLPVPSNIDHVTQRQYTEYVATGTKYRAGFDATRSKNGGVTVPENRSGDGVVLRSPLPITKINVGFSVTNLQEDADAAVAVGKLVVGARNGSADVWTKLLQYTTVQAAPATIAAADYQPAAPMKEFMCAVWPRDESGIPATARPDRYISASWNTDLTVTIQTTALGIVQTQPEQDIYQWSGRVITYEDGQTRTYRAIELGMYDSKLATPLNEVLRIVPATRLVERWNAAQTTLLEIVPPTAYAVRQGIWNQSGGVVNVVGDAWPNVVIQPNPLSNYDFSSGLVAPWTASQAGFTISLSVVSGKLQVAVTANTNGAGSAFTVSDPTNYPLNNRRHLWLAADLSTTNVNLRPQLRITWYKANNTFHSLVLEPTFTAVAGSEFRRIYGFVVPASVTQYQVAIQVVSVTANQIGTITIDNVWPFGAEIAYDDAGRGNVTLTAGYVESFP